MTFEILFYFLIMCFYCDINSSIRLSQPSQSNDMSKCGKRWWTIEKGISIEKLNGNEKTQIIYKQNLNYSCWNINVIYHSKDVRFPQKIENIVWHFKTE